MPRDLSVEFPQYAQLITTRTIASRLWFVNNKELEDRILAHLAKYQEEYGVIIYAFILMGNHYHLLAAFPRGNRHQFLRAFNGLIPKLTAAYVSSFIDGKLWAKRARCQSVPNPEDVLNTFLYVVQNPVSSGLAMKYQELPIYSSFPDAIRGKSKTFQIVDWSNFKNKRRHNKSLKPKDCAKDYQIHYSRLPGCEGLSKSEYERVLRDKMEERRQRIISERKEKGQGFAGAENIAKIKPGSLPRSTKTAERYTKRPLVLTVCLETKRIFLEMYFAIVSAYREASRRYLSGDYSVQFPPGTHKPHQFSPA